MDVGWFKRKGSVSAIQTAAVSMRVRLTCLSCHTVADPKSGEGYAGRQYGQWSTPPQGAHKMLPSLSDLIILCKNIYGYS